MWVILKAGVVTKSYEVEPELFTVSVLSTALLSRPKD